MTSASNVAPPLAALAIGAILIVMNVLDLWLTRWAFTNLDNVIEMNPIMTSVIHTDWGVLLKVGIPVVTAVLLVSSDNRRLTMVGGGVAALMVFIVIANSLSILANI